MGFGPEEAGTRAWFVYSYMTGSVEKQDAVEVSNLEHEDDSVIEDSDQDDLELSFDVARDDVSVVSDASNDVADRRHARKMRTKSKKVYTFEIESASDEEDEQKLEEDALEKGMALRALQEHESDTNARSHMTKTEADGVSWMAKHAREKRIEAKTRSKQEREVVGANYTTTDISEPIVSSLDCTSEQISDLEVLRNATFARLEEAHTLSYEERRELDERLAQLEIDLAAEKSKASEMTVSAVAREGLKLLNAISDDQAEQLLFAIAHSHTPLCKALVQHIGYLHSSRRRNLVLDFSDLQGQSRASSPSSTRTSVITFSMPPTSREEDVAEVEAAAEEGFAIGLLWEEIGYFKPCEGIEIRNAALSSALTERIEFSKAELDGFAIPDLALDSFIEADNHMYYRPCCQTQEDVVDAQEEVVQDVDNPDDVEVVALKALAAEGVAAGTRELQQQDAATKKKSSFFRFGRKKTEEEKSAAPQKKKGMFGGLFSTQTEVVVKEVEMPEEANKALAQVSQAEKLLEAPGKQIIVIKLVKECLKVLESHATAFKDDANAEKVRASLHTGIEQSTQTIRAAQQSILMSAESAISLCCELEVTGAVGQVLHRALEQAEVAKKAYEFLEMSHEEIICKHKIAVLIVRIESDPYMRDAFKNLEANLFRTAIHPLLEARRLLSEAPSDVQRKTEDLELTLTRQIIATASLQESINLVDERLAMCQDKLKKLVKLGPRYFNKAQIFHGNDTPEAQSKASLLYAQAAIAFFNIQEKRAEAEARKLEQMTADNVVRLAMKKAQHLEIIDEYADSIDLCDWLKAFLEHTHRTQDIGKVEQLQRSVHRKRAVTRLGALTYMCDDGLRQLKRGYARGVRLLERVREDFKIACDGAVLGDDEDSQISVSFTAQADHACLLQPILFSPNS